jgi:hypothetical protein
VMAWRCRPRNLQGRWSSRWWHCSRSPDALAMEVMARQRGVRCRPPLCAARRHVAVGAAMRAVQ